MNDFSESLLRSFGKTTFLPRVSAFLIKSVLGEMSVMLLEGTGLSNEKLKEAGFKPEYERVEDSFT